MKTNNIKLDLAMYAAKICECYDQKQQIDRRITAIYRKAKTNGLDRLELKAAVQRYMRADSGECVADLYPKASQAEAAPQPDENDDKIEKAINKVEARLAELRRTGSTPFKR